ncbi:MAG: hypothetical protein Q9162_003641 [Coniocarpon cinnabarinum]
MSIPNEALQKKFSSRQGQEFNLVEQLLQEIEQKAAVSQQQIAIVKAQIAGKNRESRLLQLTMSEMSSIPKETPVYEGIGKFFVQTNTTEVKENIDKQSGELKTDISNLEKRLHYLETTAKNSQAHIEQMLKSGGKS